MGSITREEGVLKLVRPGRRVEVHKEPITAQEVMRKYPRHSITRPDIFEFPWIVVKAEAVLTPGKVFFIVPNRTIYQLLKAREHGYQSSFSSSSQQQRQSARDHGHHPASEQLTSPPKAYAGVTLKHQERRRRLKHQFFSCATVSPSDEEVDSDKGLQTDSQVGAWPGLSSTNKKTHGKSKQKPQINSKIKTRYGRVYDYSKKNNITAKLAGLEITDSKQVTLLKSCLRKPDSARKSLRLKVAFTLPNKDEE
ncbi:hypothetical protein PRUPE_8G203000 [Prunus persica]|uniref:Uncharacterized protein n=1 Tax=Prunus persica TaxID=3760 RepID=M5VHL6_PRUPE|nr:hypothetical protein PRUPE_8G203000 [Prunus persica]